MKDYDSIFGGELLSRTVETFTDGDLGAERARKLLEFMNNLDMTQVRGLTLVAAVNSGETNENGDDLVNMHTVIFGEKRALQFCTLQVVSEVAKLSKLKDGDEERTSNVH